jgi:hypothetical protein
MTTETPTHQEDNKDTTGASGNFRRINSKVQNYPLESALVSKNSLFGHNHLRKILTYIRKEKSESEKLRRKHDRRRSMIFLHHTEEQHVFENEPDF